jgi:hypothetical protein
MTSSGEELRAEQKSGLSATFAPMQPKQRKTDNMLLAREVREMKEKLLDYVDEIIVRQNGVDPVANIETFQLENLSRKVTKELLLEF